MFSSLLAKKRTSHPCAPAPKLIRQKDFTGLQLILKHFLMDIVLKLGQLDGLGTNGRFGRSGISEGGLKLMALHRQVFPPAHDPVPVVRIDFLNGLPLRFGKMERFEGRFECVYFMEGDTITRIQVLDLKKNETQYDNTKFYIERQLRSDPTKVLAIQSKGVVRAIG